MSATGFAIQGHRITVPVEVRSATMVQASWLVSATAAQDLIDYSGLRVVRQLQSLAMLSVAAVQYTDNDLGPYNEIAVALVVEPPDGPAPSGQAGPAGPMTTFIHRLPVNQTLTCEAGRDIWGFPKWVADISWRDEPARADVVMIDDDQLVLGLSVSRRGIPVPPQEIEMTCYSWRDGVLRRTPWTNRTQVTRARPAGARIELGSGHPMADELRALGLPKAPIFSMSVGHLAATFGPAEVV